MVQWLSIHLPVKGTQVWSLVPEDPRFHRIPKPVYHSYLSPHALEPGKAPQWEARTLQLESSPRSTTTSFPGSSDGKASACNAGELVGKIPLEKEMAPHSSTLAWKIPWMEEPGRLQSMGSQRIRYDWATSLALTTTRESLHTATKTQHNQK